MAEQSDIEVPRIIAARSVLWNPHRTREWEVHPFPLPLPVGYSLVTTDASGGLYGFGVQAGWPEMGKGLLEAVRDLMLATGCLAGRAR
jgi:hypothetical protein